MLYLIPDTTLMAEQYRKGACGALLAEYEKAIAALKIDISDIRDADWEKIVDPLTTDENCRSCQAIMTHVVSSAYSYATYIGQFKGQDVERPEKKFRQTAAAYARDLDDAFRFTVAVFETIKDDELERFEDVHKIHTLWGQAYDIEQLMEHAIVHILRHRRQIERLKPVL